MRLVLLHSINLFTVHLNALSLVNKVLALPSARFLVFRCKMVIIGAILYIRYYIFVPTKNLLFYFLCELYKKIIAQYLICCKK